MAWYDGTYSCGHKGRVNVVGKVKDRQWKIDHYFQGLCPDCWEKKRQEDSEKVIALAKEYEFPDLTGTEKQILWANTIRMEFYIDCCEAEYDPDDMINTETTAKFWIDNREELHSSHFLRKYKQYFQKKKAEESLIDSDTVRPSNLKHPGVVEIVDRQNTICLLYEKDEEFIKLVKDYHYVWNGVWCRSLKESTGPFSDRAAEIGHALLKAGFAICIHDKDTMEKAVNGDYALEHTRWIYSRTGSSLLAINWMGRNEDLYRAARKIKGSKWDGGSIVVDVSHHNLVEEFAEENGFRFTQAAKAKIEKYKEELKNTREVTV